MKRNRIGKSAGKPIPFPLEKGGFMEIKFHPVYNRYASDIQGNVYGVSGKIIKGCVATVGYRQYDIAGNTYLGHRFIWECFNGEIPKELHVNHIDHNKQNNQLSNLELLTPEKNVQYYYEQIGIHSIKSIKLSSRTKTTVVKLTKDQVKELIQEALQGVPNKVLGEKYGVHERYVSLIRHKKRWKSVWLEMGLETSTTIPSGSRVK